MHRLDSLQTSFSHPFLWFQDLAVLSYSDNIAHVVNVDTTSLEGLQRANELGLVESGLANVVASPFLAEVAELFRHKANTGRVFAVLRHPVESAIAHYLMLRETLPPRQTRLSLFQYAHSPYLIDNFMVKTLINVTDAVVTEDHVEMAKSVLERFAVVGLWNHLEESMERFYNHFGWTRPESYNVCQGAFISVQQYQGGEASIEEGSDEYHTMVDRNWADMMLWEEAQRIWDRQGQLTAGVVR